MEPQRGLTRQQKVTVTILTFVNLINYMDRYTIASMLRDIQNEYQISDSQAGALQTAFVISYMVFAPIFGYLGDRYSRKHIMALGIATWVAATLIGSFMPDYTSFMLMRGIVGIGEASYSTIAPTIISDLFVKEARSKMLAIFYFAIPVGSGLGYVIGRTLATTFDGDWHWSLRGTPILGLPAVFLMLVVMEEPPRGEAEGHGSAKATGYRKDLKSLGSNRSFILSTVGFTCVTFCAGALAWWAPKFIEDSIISTGLDESERPLAVSSVSLFFGSIAMAAGMLGVPLGAFLSTRLASKFNGRSDPIICGVGLLFSSMFIMTAFKLAHVNVWMCFTLMFVGEVALNLNWSIVADIVLSVVVPTRRGSAEAFQILISHLLGDAGSPYLIGVVSEYLKSTSSFSSNELCTDVENEETCKAVQSYYPLQYSLMGNVIIMVLGGFCFFLNAVYIREDKMKVEKHFEVKGESDFCKPDLNSGCVALLNGGAYVCISNSDSIGNGDSCEGLLVSNQVD